MSIIDWIFNRLPSERAKNLAFHAQLDGMMSEMRRDICMACGERAGEPYDGGGYKPTICGLCRSLLEVKCHPKIPEHMCDEYLRMWGTPEAVEAFLEEARQREDNSND
jgi:hypothetical protein